MSESHNDTHLKSDNPIKGFDFENLNLDGDRVVSPVAGTPNTGELPTSFDKSPKDTDREIKKEVIRTMRNINKMVEKEVGVNTDPLPQTPIGFEDEIQKEALKGIRNVNKLVNKTLDNLKKPTAPPRLSNPFYSPPVPLQHQASPLQLPSLNYNPASLQRQACFSSNLLYNEKIVSMLTNTFQEAARQPEFVFSSNIDVLKVPAFQKKTEHQFMVATYRLETMTTDRPRRMAGQSMLENFRVLRDNLITRINSPALVEPNMLITFKAEMDVLSWQIDQLEVLLNHLDGY